MAFFPLFMELKGRKVLVVGAGTVAARRITALAEFGAEITVVAKEVSSQVKALAESGNICLIRADYRDYRNRTDLDGPFFLVLTATGDEAVDRQAAEDGRSRNAFVNLAGDQTQSDFYFPGIAKEQNLVVGITAGGTNHALVKQASEYIRICLKAFLKGDTIK